MLDDLKKRVFKANMALKEQGLVVLTWGNASAYDDASGYVIIKPSGVAYETMRWEDMVVVDLNGSVIEGTLKPSSDTPTHIRLYQHYGNLRGIVHTHSRWATIFAQAAQPIQPLGTTHGDYFQTTIPVTTTMPDAHIDEDYEYHTAMAIENAYHDAKTDPLACPAVLVKEHGPFTFGSSVEEALQQAIVLEEVAMMAYHTHQLNPSITTMNPHLHHKHYQRKHGKNAYYGQNSGNKE